MRVIQVTNDVGPASGVGTFVRRVNAELVKLGVDSSIVTTISEFEAVVNSTPSAFTVIHIHGLWLKLHHAAAVWAKAHGAMLVWSTHGMTAPWAMRHKRWKKLIAWWLYQRRDLKRADIIHSTTGLEIVWNRRFGLGRQCEIPLGSELGEMASGSQARPKVLLFVGRIYPVKAIDRLIRAVAMLNSRELQLRIVGPDEAGHLAELVSLCDRLGLSYSTPDVAASATPQVSFVGPKFGAELSAEYANCTALALVSHSENFGATVVDALAHGKPVITGTKTPWRIVKERGCGWWVDNEPDAIAKAIDEMITMTDEARTEMGCKGRALVEEKYTWQAVGRSMLEAYDKLSAAPVSMNINIRL